MGRRKSFAVVVFLLLVIPFFCEAIQKRDTETEDSSSGEAEIPQPREHVVLEGSPNEGEDDDQSPVVHEGQGQDTIATQEEAVQQSTTSPMAAVGVETNHLPREQDVESELREESDEDEEEEESVEFTTLLSAPSTAVPLAPIPSEEDEETVRKDSSSHPSQAQEPPHVIIWDGTGEPEREHTAAGNEAADQSEQANQPEQPTSESKQSDSQPEHRESRPEQPVGQPEQPASQPETPVSQPELPLSQELQGGANGNGLSKEPATDPSDKSDERKVEEGSVAKSVDGSSCGSTSSSMVWVVIFAVVSSALLTFGTGDSEANRASFCHSGCRHNFADFNPYAWPPTSVNRNGVTLRPIT